MNKEIKEKWVAALRGGDYKQGMYHLQTYDHTAYCCLGVLADVVDKHVPEAKSLARDALDRYGLTRDEANVLEQMNDNEGYSFDKIADYIEANL